MKKKCKICKKEIENPSLWQKTCGKLNCQRERHRENQKTYQKTAKYKAYQKTYYLRKKEER